MPAKLNEDVEFTVVDGTGIVLDAKNGVYLGTNEVGLRILQLLRVHDDPEAITAALLQEYDADEERIRSDVGKLMSELSSRGLLDVT